MARDPNLDRLIATLSAPPDTPAPAPSVSLADNLKTLAGGAIQATGYLARSGGDALNAAAGNTQPIVDGTPLQNIGKAITAAGTRVADSISPTAKQRMSESTPDGDIFKPSTWTAGTNPSLSGYALQAENVLGQIAPVAATGLITKGAVLPTLGVAGGLGGSAAAGQEEDRINQMTDADLAKVPRFAALTKAGIQPTTAREMLAGEAGQGAFATTAPISALSGITEGLPLAGKFESALTKVAGTNKLARVGVGAATDAVAEGAQEGIENAAEISGANTRTGENRDVTEGAVQNIALGSLGGAVVGGAGGLTHNKHAAGTEGGAQPGTEQAAAAAPIPTAVHAPFVAGATDAAGNVAVTPTVAVNPNAGPLSKGLATGAVAGDMDKPAMVTMSDGTVVHGDTGEVIQQAPAPTAEGEAPATPTAEASAPGVLPASPSQAEPTTVAQQATPTDGVPFMITSAMRAQLRGLGINDQQIASMTPQQANNTLAQGRQSQQDAATRQADLLDQNVDAAASNKKITSDELDAAVSRLYQSNGVIDSAATTALAKRLGVSRKDIFESKKRVAVGTETGTEPAPAAEAETAPSTTVTYPTIAAANKAARASDTPVTVEKTGEKTFELRPSAEASNAATAAQESANGNEESAAVRRESTGPESDGTGGAGIGGNDPGHAAAAVGEAGRGRSNAVEDAGGSAAAETENLGRAVEDGRPSNAGSEQGSEDAVQRAEVREVNPSGDLLDSDITTPSGSPFTIRDAAEKTAARHPGHSVVELDDGGYVVREGVSNAGTESVQGTEGAAKAADRAVPAAESTGNGGPADTGRAGGAATAANANADSEGSTGRPDGGLGAVADEGKAAGAGSAPDLTPNAAGVIPVKDVYGNTHHIKPGDLSSTREQLRTYTAEGKPKTINGSRTVHRENLDLDGTKRATTWANLPHIAALNDKPFANEAQAKAAVRRHGQQEADFEIRPVDGGFVAVRKGAPEKAEAAPVPEATTPEAAMAKARNGDPLSAKEIRQLGKKNVATLDAAKLYSEISGASKAASMRAVEAMTNTSAKAGVETRATADVVTLAQAAIPKDEERRGTDGQREAIDALPPEQQELEKLRARVADLERERNTSDVTGLRNKRAFDDDAALGWKGVGAADMDGLKALNDTIGHEAADAVLKALGDHMRTLESDGVRFYHRSGDEFAARFENAEDGAAIMQGLQDALEQVQISLSDGTRTLVYDGIGLSVGHGDSYESADAAVNADKSDRLASGKRQPPRDDGRPRRLREPAEGVQSNAGDAERGAAVPETGEAAAGSEVGESTTGAPIEETKAIGDALKVPNGTDDAMHHLFDPPAKKDVVRIHEKVRDYVKEHDGYMSKEQADAQIDEWKANAAKQGEDRQNGNGQKVVLSFFDRTGEWSKPWVEAGYQVHNFDIQNDAEMGDVNNFSTDFFNDWFSSFDGQDIHAILAACPCTDFASSGARHFAAKDADGRTVESIQLVNQTMAALEYFKPAVWALENPVGRIESLTGLPPWRMSFDPNAFGDPYTKKTLLWGRFNADLPIAPVNPVDGSKMHQKFGGKSLATKNARSITPEGFAYSFFQANNAVDNRAMTIANKYDRLDPKLIDKAVKAGVSEIDIDNAVEDPYYMDLDDKAANAAIRELIAETPTPPEKGTKADTAATSAQDPNAPRAVQADLFANFLAWQKSQGRTLKTVMPGTIDGHTFVEDFQKKGWYQVDGGKARFKLADAWKAMVASQPPSEIQQDQLNAIMATRDQAVASKPVPAETAAEIADVGQKIGGARKDLWSGRSLGIDDLAKLDNLDLEKLVKKNQVWRDPDYQQMVTDRTAALVSQGGSAKDATTIVTAIKGIRDSIQNPNPKWDRSQYERYVGAVTQVRDAMEAITSIDQLPGGMAMVKQVFGDGAVDANNRFLRTGPVHDSIVLLGRKFFSKIQDAARTWAYEASRKELPGSGAPVWMKGMDIVKQGDSFAVVRKLGQRTIKGDFPTAESAVEYLRSQHDLVELGKRYRVTKMGDQYVIARKRADGSLAPVSKPFDNANDAREFMLNNSADLLGAKKGDLLDDVRRPQLQGVNRVGPELRTGPADAEGFRENYGFRGVEFGNWTNQKDRQSYVDLAYDGLGDLARVLGLPNKAISLEGQLALAFGSRGISKALAHYEPGRKVINLTKLNGAGALAHEWGHAFDNYMADGKGFLSDNGRLPAGMRPELMDAYNGVMKAILSKEITQPVDVQTWQGATERSGQRLTDQIESLRREFVRDGTEYNKRRKPPTEAQLAKFNAIAEQMRNLSADTPRNYRDNSYSYEVTRELRDLFKEVKGKASLVDDTIDARVAELQRAQTNLASALEGRTEVVKSATDFLKNAKEIDADKGGGAYWAQKLEMFARAFEAYAQDKVQEDGGTSQYLVHGTEGGRAYPVGEERAAINAAFDKLFTTLKTETTGDNNVRLFSKATDAQAATGKLKADVLGAQIRKQVAKWTNAPVVQVVQSAADLPPSVRNAVGFDATVEAVHDNGSIYMIADRLASTERAQAVLAHEAIGHYAVETILGPQGFEAVTKQIAQLRKEGKLASVFNEVEARYGNLDESTLAAETMAVMAERGIKNGLFARMLASTRAFLRGLGFNLKFSDGDLRQIITNAGTWLAKGRAQAQYAIRPEPSYSQAQAAGTETEAAPVSFSKQPAGKPLDDIEKAANFRVGDIVQSLRDKREDWRPSWLGMLTLRQLGEVAKPYLPKIEAYGNTVQTMQTRRNGLQEQAAKTADKWLQWQRRNRDEAPKLTEVMHDATLSGVDPSAPFLPGSVTLPGGIVVPMTEQAVAKEVARLTEKANGAPMPIAVMLKADIARLKETLEGEQARREAYPELKQRYDAMSDGAKEIYNTVREAYVQRANDMQEALVNRIGGLEMNELARKDLTDRVRAHFESARVQAPYFPLARFGEYWVSAEKNGQKEFRMMENRGQQRRVQAAYDKAGYTTKAGAKIDMMKAIDGASASFMSQVTEKLTEANVDKSVSDEIYQLYLRTLPDLSVRKQFIHRKGVAGYDQDALRAFASHMNHGAYQLARLEHTQVMEKLLSAMRKDVEGLSEDGGVNAVKAARAMTEVDKRHQWIMNPSDAGWVQKVSAVNFAYYLGATPAAALVNISQGAVTTFPTLAAKHGWVKALTALTTAMHQSIRTYGNIEKTLKNADEKAAYDQLLAMGAIDRTLSHDLAGMGEGSALSYNPAWRTTMNTISHLFHKAEVFNREGAGLAAYRLSREAGEDHETAVKYAADTIFDTHFDYSNANRARFMQGNAAKVLFAFKQYSQSMSYFLWRNFYQSTRGATPTERSEARKKLIGALGVTAALSGVMGLPLMTLSMSVANALKSVFGDDDEPWDAETEFRNFLTEMLGKEFGRIAQNGPVQSLTGLAVAERTKLDQMWFKPSDQELEGRAQYDYLLEQVAGPIGGIGANAFRGAQLFNDGQIWRGAETLLPKAVRDSMKTIRFAREGVNTLAGDPLVKDLSPYQIAMQAAGFSPAEVSEKYEVNNAIKGYQKDLQNRRQHLMDAYAMAVQIRDTEAMRAAQDKIEAFNQKNPEIGISASSMRRSLMARQKFSDRMVDGLVLPAKLDAKLRERVTFGAGGDEDTED